MTFTPKFVDLVRNLTSVTGTGPVAFGSAVSGYTGLAQALQAGDQFYYCIQGLDKPHEREVGRGTMLADGRVAREAISGGLTNFTNGTKTIALVTAAEWFAKLESNGGGGGGGNAGGEPYVTPQQFGAKGDGSSDDTAAFKAAIDALDGNLTGNTGAARLFIPKGTYKLSDTLNIRASMIVEGEGPLSTVLQWTAGKSGLRIGRVNTADATTGDVPAWTVGGGDWSTIRMLGLRGSYAGAEGEYHGVELRARAYLSDLTISNWQGDGIYSLATAGGGATEGNANCATVTRVQSVGNRKGLFVDGADSNVWLMTACDFRANRTWGVDDSSFLGNTYVGCHTAANGWDGAIGSVATGCSLNNNRYYVRPGQAAWCSANGPSGTTADNQGWGYNAPGGPYNGVPAWLSGTMFREGGPYRTDNPNAKNLFLGCYAEGDQNPSQFVQPTLVVTGQHGSGMIPGVQLLDHNGAFIVVNCGPTTGSGATGSLYINNTAGVGAGGNLIFRSFDTGAPTTQAEIFNLNGPSGGYLYYNAVAGVHRFRQGGSDLMEVNGGGIELQAGKAIKVSGNQVVGARGDGVADATDAASAVTQLNALLARLRTHGLIAA